MSFLFSDDYYKVGKNGLSPAQNLCAYLGGSAIQTVGDNPVTAYRQLVQQYAKIDGVTVDPKVASAEANAVFLRSPITASLSGLWPRMIGVLLKRVPKFGFLLGYGFLVGEGEPGMAAATCASILSAPFINPVRMVEKQQRAFMKTTGAEKPLMEIFREAAAKNFMPLFRGTIPLMGHSFASAVLGLVGQPKLQKYVQKELGATGMFGQSSTNLISSAIVSPIYVMVTNPLSRLEVIMQTNSIKVRARKPQSPQDAPAEPQARALRLSGHARALARSCTPCAVTHARARACCIRQDLCVVLGIRWFLRWSSLHTPRPLHTLSRRPCTSCPAFLRAGKRHLHGRRL